MATKSERDAGLSEHLSKLLQPINNKLSVQIITVAGFILLWEIIGQLTSDLFLAAPSAVVFAVIDLFSESVFIVDLQIGLGSLLVGVGLGVGLGMIVGILMGFFELVENLLDPYFTILYSLPIVAMIPFIVLIFGVGFTPRVFIIFLFAFIPMTINALEGAKETPEDLREVGVSFGATRTQTVRQIYLPAMVPYLLTGSRLAVGRGLRGWILAELFFQIGVGGRLITYGYQFRTAYVFGLLFIFIIIGMAATQFVYEVSNIAAPWYDIDEEVEL